MLDAISNKILFRLSKILNNNSTIITSDDVNALTSCGVSDQYAMALLLANYCGMFPNQSEMDSQMFRTYFIPFVKKLSPQIYQKDTYCQNINFAKHSLGSISFSWDTYKPFECFVCNDLVQEGNKTFAPIGFFTQEFSYPAIFENEHLWMSVTPNEIETMKDPIFYSTGKVLTYGLGMGYFAYHVSLKKEVQELTIIEKNQDIIELFKRLLLPQFPNKEKIKIICEDAIDYAKKIPLTTATYDSIFADLWHDVGDGLALYQQLKNFEYNKNTRYMYWIEKSLKCYL